MMSEPAKPNTSTWDVVSAGDDPVMWSIDASAGIVQGPLELEFFAGRNLLLNLESGQIALLVHNTELLSVYFEGAHSLRIGRKTNEVRPDCELVFLAADTPFSVLWDQSQSIWIGTPDGQSTKLPVSGACSCRIGDVTSFFDAFLRGSNVSGDSFVLQIIDCLIRSRIELRLNEFCENEGFDPQAMQDFADNLAAEDMNPSLARIGLTCEHLSIHLPHTGVPASSNLATGQSASIRLNQSS